MPISSQSVLVTGGASFIGGHRVEISILENQKELVIVDTFFLGSERNLRDPRAVRPELEGPRLDASNSAAMQDVVTDPYAELQPLGFTPYDRGYPIDAAIVQADLPKCKAIRPQDHPGVVTFVDGRRSTPPGLARCDSPSDLWGTAQRRHDDRRTVTVRARVDAES